MNIFRKKPERVIAEVLRLKDEVSAYRKNIDQVNAKIEEALKDPDGFNRQKINEEILQKVRGLEREIWLFQQRLDYQRGSSGENNNTSTIIKSLLEELNDAASV